MMMISRSDDINNHRLLFLQILKPLKGQGRDNDGQSLLPLNTYRGKLKTKATGCRKKEFTKDTG